MELTQQEKQFIAEILRKVTLPAEQGHFAVEIARKLELPQMPVKEESPLVKEKGK